MIFYDEFERESRAFDEELQDELLAHAILLRNHGPILGRPTVDTLKGSRHANMKELRFDWRGKSWRVAFACDPKRRAILLAGGNKAGVDQRRFYRNSSLSPIGGSTLTWRRWASRRAVEEEGG